MLDVSSSEFLLVMVIALVVIGPKDLPKVLRVVGKWVSKARAITAQFRSGFDEMVRQSELEELEKKWKEENERIMADHPADSVQETLIHPSDKGSLDANEGSEPEIAGPEIKPRRKKTPAPKTTKSKKTSKPA